MRRIIFTIWLCIVSSGLIRAEDGSRLWLRFQPREAVTLPAFTAVSGDKDSFALQQFQEAWTIMAGSSLSEKSQSTGHTLLIGTPKNGEIRKIIKAKELRELGTEGYVIRTVMQGKKRVTLVASAGEG